MKKTLEYAIYDEDGNFVDVMFFTKNEIKDYKKEYPHYLIEEIVPDELENIE